MAESDSREPGYDIGEGVMLSRATYGGIKYALRYRDSEWLQEVLQTPEGRTIPRTWEAPACTAAGTGDLDSLRVLRMHGFEMGTRTWEAAAREGHLRLLSFAAENRYAFRDARVLEAAVVFGHVDCVRFLVGQGVGLGGPMELYRKLRPRELRCIELLADMGVPICPKSLVHQAALGDVDTVRWLHQRGLPLWDRAVEAGGDAPDADAEEAGTLQVPAEVEPIWKAMRYGAAYGAPVTPHVAEYLRQMRKRTHAVLGCFKAAARLSGAPGPEEQTRIWGGMAALPKELVEEILILADLEIPESVMRRLPIAH